MKKFLKKQQKKLCLLSTSVFQIRHTESMSRRETKLITFTNCPYVFQFVQDGSNQWLLLCSWRKSHFSPSPPLNLILKQCNSYTWKGNEQSWAPKAFRWTVTEDYRSQLFTAMATNGWRIYWCGQLSAANLDKEIPYATSPDKNSSCSSLQICQDLNWRQHSFLLPSTGRKGRLEKIYVKSCVVSHLMPQG